MNSLLDTQNLTHIYTFFLVGKVKLIRNFLWKGGVFIALKFIKLKFVHNKFLMPPFPLCSIFKIYLLCMIEECCFACK